MLLVKLSKIYIIYNIICIIYIYKEAIEEEKQDEAMVDAGEHFSSFN